MQQAAKTVLGRIWLTIMLQCVIDAPFKLLVANAFCQEGVLPTLHFLLANVTRDTHFPQPTF